VGPQQYKVALIQHTKRYSDLRLHTYVPANMEEGGWVGFVALSFAGAELALRMTASLPATCHRPAA
jgi:hypothetical protein